MYIKYQNGYYTVSMSSVEESLGFAEENDFMKYYEQNSNGYWIPSILTVESTPFKVSNTNQILAMKNVTYNDKNSLSKNYDKVENGEDIKILKTSSNLSILVKNNLIIDCKGRLHTLNYIKNNFKPNNYLLQEGYGLGTYIFSGEIPKPSDVFYYNRNGNSVSTTFNNYLDMELDISTGEVSIMGLVQSI